MWGEKLIGYQNERMIIVRKNFTDVKNRRLLLLVCRRTNAVSVLETTSEKLSSLKSKLRHGKPVLAGDAVARCIAAGGKPEMYEMETVTGTWWDSLPVKVALLRVAEDSGYAVADSGNVERMVAMCEPETNTYYGMLKGMHLDELIGDRLDIYKDYKTADERRYSSRNEESGKQIRHVSFDCSIAQYDKILKKAEFLGVSIAELMRMHADDDDVSAVSRNGRVDSLCDCSCAIEHLCQTCVSMGGVSKSVVEELWEICHQICSHCAENIAEIQNLRNAINACR